ncbi:Hypothetical_protein [Hexamita inflata]|uniref:Hypothetical_protein n=1 Tax=Hexamita inflata TaxID=28002 RepID=A0AA86NKZ0_9EUKA|nr:Hypothetical protein HINF_LOCUS9732 [Hexamita inflata]
MHVIPIIAWLAQVFTWCSFPVIFVHMSPASEQYGPISAPQFDAAAAESAATFKNFRFYNALSLIMRETTIVPGKLLNRMHARTVIAETASETANTDYPSNAFASPCAIQ